MKSDTCREKLKGKREVYRRSDGRQESAMYSQWNFTGSQWSSFSSDVIWSYVIYTVSTILGTI